MADELQDVQFNEGGASGAGFSEIKPFLECPKAYQYGQVRGIYRPTSQTPDYFAVGGLVHAGRARWFADKQSTSAETWDRIRADVRSTREGYKLPVSEQAEVDALRYITEYVEHYSVRPKPNIVAVEHMLGPFKLGEAEGSARTARLDDFGFYPEAGGLAIGECKTSSAPISDAINQYTLHGQPVLQKILWDIAHQGAATYGPVKGIVMDIIQKGYAGKRCNFARIFVPVEERVQQWWQKWLLKALEGRNAVTWNSDEERRISSCTRLEGKARVACQFRELCMFGKSAALEYAMKDGTLLSQWQPSEGKETAPWE